MSCEEHRPALTEVALGEPAGPPLDAHLAVCLGCRAVLEDDRHLLGRIDSAVEATLQVAPSAGFLPRVRQRVEERDSRRRWWRWWLVPAAAAAAGVLALLRPAPAPVTHPTPPPRAATEASEARGEAPPAAVPTVRVRRAAVEPPAALRVLIPRGETEAFQRYLVDLRQALASPPTAGVMANASGVEMPPSPLTPLPTQTAVASIDPAVAPREIEIGAIRIALIGVQPLTMESWNEE